MENSTAYYSEAPMYTSYLAILLANFKNFLTQVSLFPITHTIQQCVKMTPGKTTPNHPNFRNSFRIASRAKPPPPAVRSLWPVWFSQRNQKEETIVQKRYSNVKNYLHKKTHSRNDSSVERNAGSKTTFDSNLRGGWLLSLTCSLTRSATVSSHKL